MVTTACQPTRQVPFLERTDGLLLDAELLHLDSGMEIRAGLHHYSSNSLPFIR